jgi:hypothetical protein
MKKWNAPVVEAHDKRLLAFHEAGHCVAATHFGLRPSAYISRIGEPTSETRAFIGRTLYHQTTPFRKSVIGWSGVIAEYLADEPVEE